MRFLLKIGMRHVVGIIMMLGFSHGDTTRYLGITESRHEEVELATEFQCDGSVVLPISKLNDEFCDCIDGSDEPGTAACSYTAVTFHCENRGHLPRPIPTAWVNDGICDCCDGGDEYRLHPPCVNRCADEAAALAHAQKEVTRVFEAGQTVRHQYAQTASRELEEKRLSIEAAEQKVSKHMARLDELSLNVQAEEVLEKEERVEKRRVASIEVCKDLGLTELPRESLEALVLHLGLDHREELVDHINTERTKNDLLPSTLQTEIELFEMQKEEIKKKRRIKEEAGMKRSRMLEEEIQKLEQQEMSEDLVALSEEYPSADEETDYLDVDEDEGDYDTRIHPIASLFDKMNISVHTREEANAARVELSNFKSVVSAAEAELSSLQEETHKDYGPDDVFFALRDECFSATVGQYVYKACFFGEATQDSVSLGTWSGFEENYRKMAFKGGQSCWDGPERSLMVKLTCGEANQLRSVEEPEKCVYIAELVTPASCL